MRTQHISYVVACATILTSIGSAQQDAQKTVQRRTLHADSLYYAGGFADAASEYRAVLAQDSKNALTWYKLGASLEKAGNADDAIAAYSRATGPGPQQPGAELGLTRLFAQQPGKTDQALEHLRSVAKAGIDPSALDQAPALASLRALPQYAAIRKLAEDVRYPCRNVHTFDFWAGDFDAGNWADTQGLVGGQLHNTRDYEGCVFVEHWMPKPGRGPAGTSFTYYDATKKVWRFVWNDDNNGSIELEGDYRDGAMRFEGPFVNSDGTKALARNVLQNVSPDTIRHTFFVSVDGGKTWTQQANDRFVRRKTP